LDSENQSIHDDEIQLSGDENPQSALALTDRMLTLAYGDSMMERYWRNWSGTVQELSDKWFVAHKVGGKDGPCITQGHLVDSQRIAKNVSANYIVMFDHDNGETIDEIEKKIEEFKLAAILWTTFNHGKAETEIDQDALVRFMRKSGSDSADLMSAAKLYLAREKRVLERVLETASSVEEIHKPGGVKVVVKHAPMHRVRSLFILDEPFRFSGMGQTQKERIDGWKSRYLGLADKLALGIDNKCVDPSRLMFLPRCRDESRSSHEIRFIVGNTLCWQGLPTAAARVPTTAPSDNKVAKVKPTLVRSTVRRIPELKTEGLKDFVLKHSFDFQAADWMQTLCECRGENDGKFTFECPLDDMHSDSGNPADKGFFCTNGDPARRATWTMWCQHTTCSAHASLDRAKYLDAACQKYGVTEASELEEFCLPAEENPREINLDDGHNSAVARATQLFEQGNARDPRVFWSPFFSKYVRVESSRPEVEIEELRNDAQWQFEVGRHADFVRGKGERTRSVSPPAAVIAEIRANSALKVPVCKSIVRVPLFSRDGSLRTSKGYDAASETYLAPWAEFLPVPDHVDDATLDRALAKLELPLRDFPFSDVFLGEDGEPVRVSGTNDCEGFPLPNYGRGNSSRTHALAMLLTPIVRQMIQGPTPAYLVDKPKPGTGATLLLKLVSAVVYGRSIMGTLGQSRAEIGKQVTAKLKCGHPLLIFDNVDQHVDSADLAAAITGGYWQGRILGTSNETNVEIKATWAFSGNSGSFSPELMRRTVPIRLDASTDDPAQDRGETYFKLASMQTTFESWVDQNKTEIVWALHVLVKYWQGCCDDGYVYTGETIASFEEYSRIVGGILSSCGFTGFLENRKAYLETRNDERDADKSALAELYDAFKDEDRGFTASQAVEKLRDTEDPGQTQLKYEILPLERSDRQRKATGLSSAVGRWLHKMTNEGVHRLPNGDNVRVSRKGQYYAISKCH